MSLRQPNGVACIHSRSSRHKGLMHLLRNLVFIEAYHGFPLVPRYIDTHANYLADDLSRDRVLSKGPPGLSSSSSGPTTADQSPVEPQADCYHAFTWNGGCASIGILMWTGILRDISTFLFLTLFARSSPFSHVY